MPADLPAARPAFIPPMQAKLVDQLPSGKDWLYELKLDGNRALAIKVEGRVQLISRNQKDLTRAYPEIVNAIAALDLSSGVLDGEIVALDASGKPSFQALQHAPAPTSRARPIYYYAFDLLNLEGKATTSLPLIERKLLLAEVLASAASHCRFLPALEGERDDVIAAVREQHLEGVVAKRALSVYESDQRSGAWVKFKLGHKEEFVIGGYTRGRGDRSEFGALIVGYYEQGQLRYASKVGTGFSSRQIREFVAGTEPLRQAQSPFDSIPESEGSS
jgi:bifunctional non-homologous end joining protein LigD